ncbi:MAG TPA: peptidylprolyl isomerase [Sneathiellales bacterium]|nr:peptidylprolyl isomerase [Sneathiellales bacterium]
MRQIQLASIVVTLCFAMMALASPGAHAEDDDPVVAMVNGTDIHGSEVESLVSILARQYASVPKPELQRQVLKRLIERRVIVQASIKEGLNNDPVIMRRFEDMRQDLLQEIYLSRRADVEITEDILHAEYEKLVASRAEEIEVHGRHILLEDEATAMAMIVRLDDGADFAELAQKNSTGPTAERGGDLGFFPKSAMAAPFAEAAFDLAPGNYTQQPVKTQFGWHVIKIEERRPVSVPTFEESVDGLSSQLIGKMVDELRQTADVEIYTDRLMSSE